MLKPSIDNIDTLTTMLRAELIKDREAKGWNERDALHYASGYIQSVLLTFLENRRSKRYMTEYLVDRIATYRTQTVN